MIHPVILSHFQTAPLLKARDEGKHRMKSSLDLGLTKVEVSIETEGARFTKHDFLPWHAIEKINRSENSCFIVEGEEARKIKLYSEITNRHYSLMPTHKAPTMLVSGILMHRIKGTDPYSDTLEKIKTIKPLVGEVLDTATGLGYTAIEASKTANQVITIELDPSALEMARLNPWSQTLFNNPKITQRIGDSYDLIREFEDNTFSRIIHDPPTLSLAGHLYSVEFYAEIYRVLCHTGRLFHYIGNPESRSVSQITRGVMDRLREVGFSSVTRQPNAFGVTAFK